MKDLGERIKQAIARIDAMQQQIQTILKEKEMEDRCSKCNHRCNEDCAHPELTDADYGLEPIEVDYIETYDIDEDLPLFTKSQAEEAASYLWKYAMDHATYMPDENHYEPDWDILDAASTLHSYVLNEGGPIENVQEAMELYTTLQQPTDYRETAEDTGTVKYTADGLYDYGYEPIDEDIPF